MVCVMCSAATQEIYFFQVKITPDVFTAKTGQGPNNLLRITGIRERYDEELQENKVCKTK